MTEGMRKLAEQIEERQRTIWADGLVKYIALRSCDLGLCGEIDTRVDAANTTRDPKKRAEHEEQIRLIREERKEIWNRVDRAITQLEITKRLLAGHGGLIGETVEGSV